MEKASSSNHHNPPLPLFFIDLSKWNYHIACSSIPYFLIKINITIYFLVEVGCFILWFDPMFLEMSRKLGVESCARLFFYFYIKWSVSYISTFARDCVCIDALINKATLVVSLFWATALSSAMWILLHSFKEVFV